MSDFDIIAILNVLATKRPVFHFEADFQFALAWEINIALPAAEIRLEYPPAGSPNKYVDILVYYDDGVYPIELK